MKSNSFFIQIFIVATLKLLSPHHKYLMKEWDDSRYCPYHCKLVNFFNIKLLVMVVQCLRKNYMLDTKLSTPETRNLNVWKSFANLFNKLWNAVGFIYITSRTWTLWEWRTSSLMPIWMQMYTNTVWIGFEVKNKIKLTKLRKPPNKNKQISIWFLVNVKAMQIL